MLYTVSKEDVEQQLNADVAANKRIRTPSQKMIDIALSDFPDSSDSEEDDASQKVFCIYNNYFIYMFYNYILKKLSLIKCL